MTALMSLKSRLALAKLALYVDADQADTEKLKPVLLAGIDLLVIGSSGELERDVEQLAGFRQLYARLPLLLAIDNDRAAPAASADVVHLPRPSWWQLRSLRAGHEWTLFGRNANRRNTLEKPGERFNYLFVGPLQQPTDELVAAAVAAQPPLLPDSLPWFALGDFQPGEVTSLISAGVRRIALQGAVLESAKPAETVAEIRQLLLKAWEDQAEDYCTWAAGL